MRASVEEVQKLENHYTVKCEELSKKVSFYAQFAIFVLYVVPFFE